MGVLYGSEKGASCRAHCERAGGRKARDVGATATDWEIWEERIFCGSAMICALKPWRVMHASTRISGFGGSGLGMRVMRVRQEDVRVLRLLLPASQAGLPLHENQRGVRALFRV